VQFVRNDPRSDLFALGVMLYHFTTGERPFGAPDSVRGPAPAPVCRPGAAAQPAADCPPWLQEVILQCLEVKPDALPEWCPAGAGLQDPSPGDADRAAPRRCRPAALIATFKRWFFALGAEPAHERVKVAVASS
jgi:serine/threonine protein kinase